MATSKDDLVATFTGTLASGGAMALTAGTWQALKADYDEFRVVVLTDTESAATPWFDAELIPSTGATRIGSSVSGASASDRVTLGADDAGYLTAGNFTIESGGVPVLTASSDSVQVNASCLKIPEVALEANLPDPANCNLCNVVGEAIPADNGTYFSDGVSWANN